MCEYKSNNSLNDKENDHTLYEIAQFPHTLFFIYMYNQHYDMYVSRKKTYYKPFYGELQNSKTRSSSTVEYTNLKDTPYFRSEDEYKELRDKFESKCNEIQAEYE